MGKIMLAKDRDLRRQVAIKVLKEDLMSSPVMTRFIAEAQVTAQLDHPNIVPIYSLEIDPSGSVSFAMKLIHGKTLKDMLEEVADRYAKGMELDRRHQLLDIQRFDQVGQSACLHGAFHRLTVRIRRQGQEGKVVFAESGRGLGTVR